MGGASPASGLRSICWAASLAAGPAPSQCPGPPPPPSAARWKYQPVCLQKWGEENSVWKGRGAKVYSCGSVGNSVGVPGHPELGRGQAWRLWGAAYLSRLFTHRLNYQAESQVSSSAEWSQASPLGSCRDACMHNSLKPVIKDMNLHLCP